MATPVKTLASVTEVLVHADDLRSYILTPARPLPGFMPGQFLHLALDAWDPSAHWPESRVFSIASSPLERTRLRITVSRQGAFTRRLFAELAPGRRVWLKLPYGAFSPDLRAPGRLVLLAGGSGVTPFVSLLLWAAARHPDAAIDVHYGARDADLLIYRDAIAALGARALPALRLQCYAESTPEGGVAGGVELGRLSVAHAWSRLEEPHAARYCLSGPKPMIDAFRRELVGRGVPAAAVLSDDWG